jgi:hypothetical protein
LNTVRLGDEPSYGVAEFMHDADGLNIGEIRSNADAMAWEAVERQVKLAFNVFVDQPELASATCRSSRAFRLVGVHSHPQLRIRTPALGGDAPPH